jgi:membrane protein
MQLSRDDLRRPIDRAAGAPPPRGLVDIVVAVARQIQRDKVLELSAALAYRFFLTIFPFMIFVAAAGAFVADWLPVRNPAKTMVDALGSTVPSQVASLIQGELQQVIGQQRVGLLSIGALAALWFGSGGTRAVMSASNEAYEVEETRPFWRRYLLSIVLTLVAGLGVVLAFVLFVPLEVFGHEIASATGLGAAYETAAAVAKWPIAFILLFVAVVMLYRLAPATVLPWRRVAVGALLFSLGWLIATWAFAFYLSNFGHYDATYGALAGVVVLLIWFYLTALLLLAGAEINSVLDRVAERTADRSSSGNRTQRSRASAEGEGEETGAAAAG